MWMNSTGRRTSNSLSGDGCKWLTTYFRWHADLKPDNIVRVHGEFKLADFGFAKFTRKQADKLPSEHMRGGTDSYGNYCVASCSSMIA